MPLRAARPQPRWGLHRKAFPEDSWYRTSHAVSDVLQDQIPECRLIRNRPADFQLTPAALQAPIRPQHQFQITRRSSQVRQVAKTVLTVLIPPSGDLNRHAVGSHSRQADHQVVDIAALYPRVPVGMNTSQCNFIGRKADLDGLTAI